MDNLVSINVNLLLDKSISLLKNKIAPPLFTTIIVNKGGAEHIKKDEILKNFAKKMLTSQPSFAKINCLLYILVSLP